MQVDGDSSHISHGVVAYSKKRKHKIDLLNSDGVILIGIKDGDGGNNKDREHEKSDVIVSHIAVEDIMIMIFFNKKIIILLDNNIFPANQFGLSIGIKKLIVKVWSLLNQF